MRFISNNVDYKILDEGRRLALMSLKENSKKEDFSKFDIEITFYYGEEVKEVKVIIPVTNDAIISIKSSMTKNSSVYNLYFK